MIDECGRKPVITGGCNGRPIEPENRRRQTIGRFDQGLGGALTLIQLLLGGPVQSFRISELGRFPRRDFVESFAGDPRHPEKGRAEQQDENIFSHDNYANRTRLGTSEKKVFARLKRVHWSFVSLAIAQVGTVPRLRCLLSCTARSQFSVTQRRITPGCTFVLSSVVDLLGAIVPQVWTTGQGGQNATVGAERQLANRPHVTEPNHLTSVHWLIQWTDPDTPPSSPVARIEPFGLNATHVSRFGELLGGSSFLRGVLLIISKTPSFVWASWCTKMFLSVMTASSPRELCAHPRTGLSYLGNNITGFTSVPVNSKTGNCGDSENPTTMTWPVGSKVIPVIVALSLSSVKALKFKWVG